MLTRAEREAVRRSEPEYQAWEVSRNAVPDKCRRCLAATKIALDAYNRILARELAVDEADLVIDLEIRSKCATGLIELAEVNVCGSSNTHSPEPISEIV